MLLIKNIRLMDPKSGRDEDTDILIDDDRVVLIARGIGSEITDEEDERAALDKDTLLIDGNGLIAAPGLVDVHVHFRDPGFTYKEDVITGAEAAKAGGYTTVVCMANTKPAADNTETVKYVMEKGAETGIHVYQAGAITKGLKGQELTDMEELMKAGAPGFTDDGIPVLDESIVREAMERAAKLGVPLSFHEEDPAYIACNGVNHGKASEHYGTEGSDRKAEITLIERDLEIALETGADVNIQHISTREGVELVREAVKREADASSDGKRHIHAEACPHHFSLTEEAVIEHGTLARVNPPLRTEDDRRAVIAGLIDGTIDLIATDHAPHSAEEKGKPMTEAPSGMIGLETALALGITNLVMGSGMSLMDMLRKMTINPARLYNLDCGYVAEGGPADLVIFDPDEVWTVTDEFRSKSSNSPFVGAELKGRVKAVICGGQIVYVD